jgi:hypothetical protein
MKRRGEPADQRDVNAAAPGSRDDQRDGARERIATRRRRRHVALLALPGARLKG